jgi:hypothetical protein
LAKKPQGEATADWLDSRVLDPKEGVRPHPFTQLFCTDVGGTVAATNMSEALEIAYKIPLKYLHCTSELDEEVRSYYRWMFAEAHRQWNAPDTPRLVAATQAQ